MNNADPEKLKVGDVVVFGGKVEKTVERIGFRAIGWSNQGGDVTFFDDTIWQIAELRKRGLPNNLLFASLSISGKYYIDSDEHVCCAERLLKNLRRDVRLLEEAGVKDE